MKICHELPISLLGLSEKYNDYEYCLPTFYKKFPEYKQFYLDASKKGRFIILDNGLFEGDNLTIEELIDMAKEIQPDVFVVPDAWNDVNTTYQSAELWMKKWKAQLPEKTELMVVLQGTDFDEILDLYEACDDIGYTHFGINASSIAYQDFGSPNKQVNAMFGRIMLITALKEHFDLIKPNHYIHLLGGSLPQEFLYYPAEYDFIKSVDTSNPILIGLSNIRYNGWGLLEKPLAKMEVFVDVPNLLLRTDLIANIDYNVHLFRSFVEKK